MFHVVYYFANFSQLFVSCYCSIKSYSLPEMDNDENPMDFLTFNKI